MGWIVGLVAFVVVCAVLYFEIYYYEGYHFGPRIQSWFYDQWAARYDLEKQESQAHDAEQLAHPLLETLDQTLGRAAPALILDVATGTGRLPLVLVNEAEFRGRLIGLDISRGMLERAAQKLAGHRDRVALVRHAATPLPFPDETFDVVSCLESLMIMRDKRAPLAEFIRVLRPGGILLTSRGRETLGPVGKAPRPDDFVELLREAGFKQIEIRPWWKLFDQVWAHKPGEAVPAGERLWVEVLRCPTCGATGLEIASPAALRCRACEATVPVSPDGIVLYDVQRDRVEK